MEEATTLITPYTMASSRTSSTSINRLPLGVLAMALRYLTAAELLATIQRLSKRHQWLIFTSPLLRNLLRNGCGFFFEFGGRPEGYWSDPANADDDNGVLTSAATMTTNSETSGPIDVSQRGALVGHYLATQKHYKLLSSLAPRCAPSKTLVDAVVEANSCSPAHLYTSLSNTLSRAGPSSPRTTMVNSALSISGRGGLVVSRPPPCLPTPSSLSPLVTYNHNNDSNLVLAAVVVYNRRVYVLGGKYYRTSLPYDKRLSSAAVYDPTFVVGEGGKDNGDDGCDNNNNAITPKKATSPAAATTAMGRWRSLPPMAHRRSACCGVYCPADGLIYVFGGFDGLTEHDSVAVLDPTTREWVLGGAAPEATHPTEMPLDLLLKEIVTTTTLGADGTRSISNSNDNSSSSSSAAENADLMMSPTTAVDVFPSVLPGVVSNPTEVTRPETHTSNHHSHTPEGSYHDYDPAFTDLSTPTLGGLGSMMGRECDDRCGDGDEKTTSSTRCSYKKTNELQNNKVFPTAAAASSAAPVASASTSASSSSHNSASSNAPNMHPITTASTRSLLLGGTESTHPVTSTTITASATATQSSSCDQQPIMAGAPNNPLITTNTTANTSRPLPPTLTMTRRSGAPKGSDVLAKLPSQPLADTPSPARGVECRRKRARGLMVEEDEENKCDQHESAAPSGREERALFDCNEDGNDDVGSVIVAAGSLKRLQIQRYLKMDHNVVGKAADDASSTLRLLETPYPFCEGAAAAHKHYIYLIGGTIRRSQPDEDRVATVSRLDVRTMEWSVLPSLPEPRHLHYACVVNVTVNTNAGSSVLRSRHSLDRGEGTKNTRGASTIPVLVVVGGRVTHKPILLLPLEDTLGTDLVANGLTRWLEVFGPAELHATLQQSSTAHTVPTTTTVGNNFAGSMTTTTAMPLDPITRLAAGDVIGLSHHSDTHHRHNNYLRSSPDDKLFVLSRSQGLLRCTLAAKLIILRDKGTDDDRMVTATTEMSRTSFATKDGVVVYSRPPADHGTTKPPYLAHHFMSRVRTAARATVNGPMVVHDDGASKEKEALITTTITSSPNEQRFAFQFTWTQEVIDANVPTSPVPFAFVC